MAGVLENARSGPLFHDGEVESEIGSVQAINQFFVVANNMGGAQMFEIVRVGTDMLIGEIIRLSGDTATIQLYEDTSGLQVGDTVVRTQTPLSVELGPGILDKMYDGLQRPYEEMAQGGKIYLEKGAKTPALDRSKLWEFIPQNFKIGDHITGGDIFGRVIETPLVTHHWIMLPPKSHGTITFIAPHGHYTICEEVLRVEFMGVEKGFTMVQKWPVRQPRPYEEKLPVDTPLFTGLRVYDCLFPLAIGGTCVFPGAYGCGKGITCHSIAKYSNSDIVVYVGCGERGNEMMEMLLEFPEIQIPVPVGGVAYSVIKKMTVIGNTSNMPMAAREASIYTGITTAEYFRDQGYNTTMLADSTSRWAEALKEVSNKMEEIPASSGYPSHLGSRLASFYERAGKVSCIGNPARTGAVTLVATVSPPGGDFSDPVVASSLSLCQTFWGLDKKLAMRRHFPSVNWLLSWSRYHSALAAHFEQIDPEYTDELTMIRSILQQEEELAETVVVVGKDSLPDNAKLTLETAKLIRDDFLQQNIFMPCDRQCPTYKTAWMMKNITTFYTLAKKALEQNATFSNIKTDMASILYELNTMKFKDPRARDATERDMRSLHTNIQKAFTGYPDFD